MKYHCYTEYTLHDTYKASSAEEAARQYTADYKVASGSTVFVSAGGGYIDRRSFVFTAPCDFEPVIMEYRCYWVGGQEECAVIHAATIREAAVLYLDGRSGTVCVQEPDGLVWTLFE